METQTHVWGIPIIVFSGVLSGILGASIALLGTYLQGVLQAKRQTDELAHDANERAKEREMRLRRDVYLESAGGIARLQEYLKSFGNPDLDPRTQEDIIRDVWETFNKVEITASIETISDFQQLYREFSEVSGKLSLSDRRIRILRYEVEDLDKTIEQNSNTFGQISQNLRTAQMAGDIRYYDAIKSQLEQIEAVTQDQVSSRNQKLEEYGDRLVSIIDEITEAVASLEMSAAYPTLCVRQELDLPIDREKYLALVGETQRVQKENVSRLMETHDELNRDLNKSLR